MNSPTKHGSPENRDPAITHDFGQNWATDAECTLYNMSPDAFLDL